MNTILDNNENRIKCQKFTPEGFVDFMLNEAEYNCGLFGKKVLENSFGEGNILLPIVKRYIDDSINNGYNLKTISDGLKRDIIGFELDKEIYDRCISSLNKLVHSYGLKKVQWSLYNEDFLKKNINIKFDYIIGNPPYITYRDIDDENRDYLKETFISCKKGKFDYYYAFIEKAIDLLSSKGKLVQLVPSNIYKNVFANEIRELIKPSLKSIFDYPKQKCFISVLTTSTIFVCDKSTICNSVKYTNLTDNVIINIPKERLKDKWVFDKINTAELGSVRFGDVFNASVTIATLCNEAFIVSKDTIISEGIEKKIIRNTTSPKFKKYGKSFKIIFPYYYKKNKLVRYDPEVFCAMFPNATAYLQQYRNKLDKSCKDKNAQWFEYGRSQALAHLNQEKLLISTIITNDVSVYRLSKRTIPYSGIYITSKDAGFSLSDAEEILRSEAFFNYISKIGTNINGSSIRISCVDINEYRF